MTSEKVSRRRRQLNASIPVDKKREMKDVITAEAQARTKAIHKLSTEESRELNDIKNKFREQRTQITRSFERTRADIIKKYENEFGVDAAQYAIIGMGV